MIKVAMVRADGTVAFITSPGSDDQYQDGDTYGELVAKLIPFESDDVPYVTRMTYAELGGWVDHGEPPARNYVLTRDGWEPNLAGAIAERVAAVNVWKSNQRLSFEWNGHTWDSDDDGRANIFGVVIAGIAPPSGYWTDADNVDVPITTPGEMQAMYMAMLTRAGEIHDRQRQMKIAIADCASVELVDAYVIGWP